MKPTVGRIVHFVNESGTHMAAIVTKVWTDTCVNLVVFEPYDGCPTVVRTSVCESVNSAPFSWHWPERE